MLARQALSSFAGPLEHRHDLVARILIDIPTCDWIMPACGAGVELTNQTVDQAADFGEQLGEVAEGGALSSPSCPNRTGMDPPFGQFGRLVDLKGSKSYSPARSYFGVRRCFTTWIPKVRQIASWVISSRQAFGIPRRVSSLIKWG